MSAFELFPEPSHIPASPTSPHVLPGINAESTAALREVLKDNHERWHIFFNDRNLHNHTSHHALAIWALGAPGSVIKDVYYKLNVPIQRAIYPSPEPITEANFNAHLGNPRFYDAYIKFFTDVVGKEGSDYALQQYVFSARGNVAEKGNHPEMLSRFLATLVHPMIHTSYGFEFNIPGMVVEGLAQAAIHPTTCTSFIPLSLFQSTSNGVVGSESLASQVQSTLSISKRKGVHAFTVLARLLRDDNLLVNDRDIATMFQGFVGKHGSTILHHVESWSPDPSCIEGKLEELQWLATILYGLPGWKAQGSDYNADFFLMHIATSSLFLPALLAHLPPYPQWLLLRGYFGTILSWWIARGRPAIDIAGFFAADIPKLTHQPTPAPLPDEFNTLSSTHTTPNLWLPIIQTTIIHPDDHVPKIQRALIHFDTLYGARPAGLEDFSKTELKDADKLDGSLFLRVAALTYVKVTRPSVPSPVGPFWWEVQGFYTD